jgi:hypothetical protein
MSDDINLNGGGRGRGLVLELIIGRTGDFVGGGGDGSF